METSQPSQTFYYERHRPWYDQLFHFVTESPNALSTSFSSDSRKLALFRYSLQRLSRCCGFSYCNGPVECKDEEDGRNFELYRLIAYKMASHFGRPRRKCVARDLE